MLNRPVEITISVPPGTTVDARIVTSADKVDPDAVELGPPPGYTRRMDLNRLNAGAVTPIRPAGLENAAEFDPTGTVGAATGRVYLSRDAEPA